MGQEEPDFNKLNIIAMVTPNVCLKGLALEGKVYHLVEHQDYFKINSVWNPVSWGMVMKFNNNIFKECLN